MRVLLVSMGTDATEGIERQGCACQEDIAHGGAVCPPGPQAAMHASAFACTATPAAQLAAHLRAHLPAGVRQHGLHHLAQLQLVGHDAAAVQDPAGQHMHCMSAACMPSRGCCLHAITWLLRVLPAGCPLRRCRLLAWASALGPAPWPWSWPSTWCAARAPSPAHIGCVHNVEARKTDTRPITAAAEVKPTPRSQATQPSSTTVAPGNAGRW